MKRLEVELPPLKLKTFTKDGEETVWDEARGVAQFDAWTTKAADQPSPGMFTIHMRVVAAYYEVPLSVSYPPNVEYVIEVNAKLARELAKDNVEGKA